MTLSIANRKYPTKLALYEFALETLGLIEDFANLKGFDNPILFDKHNWEALTGHLKNSLTFQKED